MMSEDERVFWEDSLDTEALGSLDKEDGAIEIGVSDTVELEGN